MATLKVVEEADDELEALYAHDPDAVETIDVFIEMLYDDPDELESLNVLGNRFKKQPPFEVKQFASLQRDGYNVYTVRIQGAEGDLLPYRVLIAYDGPTNCYHILAIAYREFNYERDHPTTLSAVDRYERAGIYRLPR